MSQKIGKKFVPFFIVALLLIANVSTVFAAPPMALHIEVAEYIGTSGETFLASGAAVDNGLVCVTGTVDDLSVAVSGPPSGDFRILNVHKRFYCGDGSFDIKMVVRLDLTTNATTARWRVAGGTGAYSALKGTGSLVGVPIVPGTSILDIYDGNAH
jgi:hypothetical protein